MNQHLGQTITITIEFKIYSLKKKYLFENVFTW